MMHKYSIHSNGYWCHIASLSLPDSYVGLLS